MTMYQSAKRFIPLLLCLLLMIPLAACAQNSGSPSVTGTPSVAPTTAGQQSQAPAVTEPVVDTDPFGKYEPGITISTVRTLDSTVMFDSTDPNTKSLEENAWSKAYEEYLGITFDYLWTPEPDQYNTKWNTAIASQAIPDMAVVDSTIYKMLVEGNLVEDCTQAYEDYASEAYKACGSAETGDNGIAQSMMTFEGKLLGIPQPGTTPDGTALLWIRKDWLDAVDMEAPQTIDELIAVAQAFVDAELGGADTLGLCVSKSVSAGQNDILGFLNGCGAYTGLWLDDGSGQLAYSTIQPEMETAILKLQEMYESGLLRQDFAVLDATTAGQDVAAGKCGITYGGYAAPLLSMKESIVGDADSQWIPLSIPTLDGSDAKPEASATPSQFIFVKKGFEYPEAAVKLINLNLKLFAEQPVPYSNATADGNIATHKYRFACSTFVTWKNLIMHQVILEAIASGDTSGLNPEQLLTYGRVVKGMNGDTEDPGTNTTRYLIFGENGAYDIIGDYRDGGNIVFSAYQALPTDTTLSLGSTLDEILNAAIFKVIMGDDISTFKTAVEEWKQGGGNTITQEVNAWYAQTESQS